jgi:hypothetical protein
MVVVDGDARDVHRRETHVSACGWGKVCDAVVYQLGYCFGVLSWEILARRDGDIRSERFRQISEHGKAADYESLLMLHLTECFPNCPVGSPHLYLMVSNDADSESLEQANDHTAPRKQFQFGTILNRVEYPKRRFQVMMWRT